MNVDELPLWILALLAAGAWSVYAMVIANELTLNRRRARVITQRMENRATDHEVEGHESKHDGNDHAGHREEQRIGHGRIVHPTPVDMPPGIPSILERLALDDGCPFHVCPECQAGKHRNCDGGAWCFAIDVPTKCACRECG